MTQLLVNASFVVDIDGAEDMSEYEICDHIADLVREVQDSVPGALWDMQVYDTEVIE
jgi:hypothetical protein